MFLHASCAAESKSACGIRVGASVPEIEAVPAAPPGLPAESPLDPEPPAPPIQVKVIPLQDRVEVPPAVPAALSLVAFVTEAPAPNAPIVYVAPSSTDTSSKKKPPEPAAPPFCAYSSKTVSTLAPPHPKHCLLYTSPSPRDS